MRRFVCLAVLLGLTGCGLLLSKPGIDRTDQRFAQCAGGAGEVDAAFPLIASEYRTHFPRMGLSPELDVDAPAFAVVFAEGEALPVPVFGLGEQGLESSSGHVVCIYVGNPPDGFANYYSNVDVGGMRR
jgi:hypothetical protein